jgi:hypothetical protein
MVVRPRLGFLEAVDAGVFHLERTGGRGVGPVELYPLQRQFITDVFDTYIHDSRPYRRAVYSVPKKWGKTTKGALAGAWHLIFDDTERYREVYSLAGDYDQAKISLKQGQRLIKQSPRLAGLVGKQIHLYERETVYIGEDQQEHRWRAMASDSPTAHGMNPSLVLVDEGWQLRDYELLEAVSLGPQRRHPLQLWTTYAGLKAQQVTGNPLYDLYQRGMAKTDPTLYFVWRSGLGAYAELPAGFIRAGYLDEQRELLPQNRFKRMHLNEWGAADASFLTEEEVARACDQALLVESASRVPHVLTCDYGRSHDHTAIVAGRPDSDAGGFRVTNAVALKGTRTNPVPIEAVEAELLDWARRYNVERIHLDPFQMIGSAERIAKILGWPVLDSIVADAKPWRKAVVLQPIGPAYLNRLTMGMLGAFRSGMVRIPGALTELVDQLGAVVAKETYYGVRVDSGAGVGVRGHDDLVIALGMALVDVERRKGPRPTTFGMASSHDIPALLHL